MTYSILHALPLLSHMAGARAGNTIRFGRLPPSLLHLFFGFSGTDVAAARGGWRSTLRAT